VRIARFRHPGRFGAAYLPLPPALLCAALRAAMLAQAGRPLATDDAASVDAAACQLETWVERTRDSRSTWINPACNPFGATEFAVGGARVREAGPDTLTLQHWQVKQLVRAPIASALPGNGRAGSWVCATNLFPGACSSMPASAAQCAAGRPRSSSLSGWCLSPPLSCAECASN
jgi:hypothetical protein